MTVGTAVLLGLGALALVFFGGGWVVGKILGWNERGDIGINGFIAVASVLVLGFVAAIIGSLGEVWNEPIG